MTPAGGAKDGYSKEPVPAGINSAASIVPVTVQETITDLIDDFRGMQADPDFAETGYKRPGEHETDEGAPEDTTPKVIFPAGKPEN
jgi:hypothetical protein